MSAPLIKTAPGGQRYAVVSSRSEMVKALVLAAAQGVLSLVVERQRYGGTAMFKLAYDHQARDEQWQLVSCDGCMSFSTCAQACEQANARLLSEALS